MELKDLTGTPFVKMAAAGNDFILIDDRRESLPNKLLPLLARTLCARRISVGADGLIILRPPSAPGEHFSWAFFNSDGSEAEMCGNGGRCAARLAFDLGIAPAQMVFGTLAGSIEAEISGENVRLRLPPPKLIGWGEKLTVAGRSLELDAINTGVPHAVVKVNDIEEVDVERLGRAIRFHERFAPAGTNANFIRPTREELIVRTYERGVEAETLACGTGAVASALVAVGRGWMKPPVRVRTRGGEVLVIHSDPEAPLKGRPWLEGPARYIYRATLEVGAFNANPSQGSS